MPPKLKALLVIVGILLVIPPALVVRARFAKSREPRVHLVPDMDNQQKYKAQQPHPWFADGRAARPWVDGTLARGALRTDTHLHQGRVNGEWATTFPSTADFRVDEKWMARGRERYEVFCSPCHGLDGYGGGTVALRADAVAAATWVKPTNLHTAGAGGPVDMAVGQLFHTITHGARTMSAYGPQIPDVRDRWAIVAYIRALQRSQNAN
ncbi:MAG: cytochrome c [Planctomycetota bacterium]